MKLDFTKLRPKIKNYIDLYYKEKEKIEEIIKIDASELAITDFKYYKNFFTPIIQSVLIERQIDKFNRNITNFRDVSKQSIKKKIQKKILSNNTKYDSYSDLSEYESSKNIIKTYKNYPYLKCIDQYLDKSDIVGSGAYATVFKINNKLVVKISDISIYGNIDKFCREDLDFCIKKELDISKKAGDLDIGPKIYKHYICKVSQNEYYLIIYMEYINGSTLRDWLDNIDDNNDFYKLQKKKIFKKLRTKLNLMHKHHIYHQDLHSANIMITNQNGILDVFIIDFGRGADPINLAKVNKIRDKLMIEDILEAESLDTNIYSFVTSKLIKNKDITIIF
jgi:hypothetical protein